MKFRMPFRRGPTHHPGGGGPEMMPTSSGTAVVNERGRIPVESHEPPSEKMLEQNRLDREAAMKLITASNRPLLDRNYADIDQVERDLNVSDGDKSRDGEVLEEHERRLKEVAEVQANLSPEDAALKASQDRLYQIHDDVERRVKEQVAELEKNGKKLSAVEVEGIRSKIATHYAELERALSDEGVWGPQHKKLQEIASQKDPKTNEPTASATEAQALIDSLNYNETEDVFYLKSSEQVDDSPKSAPEKQLSREEQMVRDTLRHDLGELLGLARSDRKKYGRLFREVSVALANEGIFGNELRLEALKKVRDLYRPSGLRRQVAISAAKGSEKEIAIANHRSNIDTSIGYLEKTAGKANVIQRLIHRRYGDNIQNIPPELQKLAGMENIVTHKEFLEAWHNYRLAENNERIETILGGQGTVPVEGHQDFIGYILRADGGELLKQMQALVPELVQGPPEPDVQTAIANKAIDQLRIPINSEDERSRWRNLLQEIMFGEDEDRGMGVIAGVTLAGIAAAGVQKVFSEGVTAQYDQPQGYG